MKPLLYWKSLKIWGKIIYIVLFLYTLAGFFLTTIFFAIRLHLTDDPGAVTFNDRKFSQLRQALPQDPDSSFNNRAWLETLGKVRVLDCFYPYDARNVLKVLSKEQDIALAEKMLLAAGPYLENNSSYQQALKNKWGASLSNPVKVTCSSLYPWVNTSEWITLKAALTKEAIPLDSVANLTGVSSRLLASLLIGEQIRLFDSKREAFKKWISPLKILVNETKISLGVMGIKEETAIEIEKNLRDRQSPYYLGPEYEHLLDFRTEQIAHERYQRLTNPGDHTYPYIYAAVYLRQIMKQWKELGYDIGDNPGVLATLFNLGFSVSKPKADPEVGGSRIVIQDQEYTFGSLAQEFYYSGELSDEFPFKGKILKAGTLFSSVGSKAESHW
jgi:hypothetical protein